MFFAFEVAGTVVGAVAGSLYIVDAYRKSPAISPLAAPSQPTRGSSNMHSQSISGDLAIEGFTCLIIFKNMFSFGLTFKAYDWLVESGIERVFYGLGAVQIVICLLSIPMCKFATLLSCP